MIYLLGNDWIVPPRYEPPLAIAILTIRREMKSKPDYFNVATNYNHLFGVIVADKMSLQKHEGHLPLAGLPGSKV